ncbi:MAG: glycosyltransferase 87 family protein [Ignisphaera sp.]|uniref:DUF2029 domain-containing protein n=1 Tax=Ignisphaera aggregans TaxID=334771 RepID=A0A7J3I909_9CREN
MIVLQMLGYDNGTIFTSKQRRALMILSLVVIIASLNIGLNYYDIMWWISWYKIVQTHGITSIPSIYALCEAPTCKAPYPPLAILIFIASYALASAIPYVIRYVVLKLVLVIAPAMIVFYILKKYRGIDVAIIWLLNLPLLQIILVLQFDVLIAMFVMLSTLYFMFNKPHYSALFITLATLIKPVAAIILPLHLFLMLIRREYKACLKYLLTSALLTAILVVPFFIASPSKFIENLVLFHSSRAPQDLSLWAIATVLEESRIVDELKFINNLWLVPFLICYSISFAILYRASKKQNIDKPILYGIFMAAFPLLLLIMFNKIGNLNYLIWIVPISLLVLNSKHIKKFYLLTSLIVLLGSLPYAIILLLMPASANIPVFIVEDLSYWDARALIMQSINYYIIYMLTLLQAYIATPLADFSTPAEMLKLFSYILLELNGLRRILLIVVILVSQSLLTITALFYLTTMSSRDVKSIKIFT